MEPGQRIIVDTAVVRLAGDHSSHSSHSSGGDPRAGAFRSTKQTAIASPAELLPWHKMRIERVKRNLTAREVAEEAGISADDLRRIETGALRDAPLIHRVDRVFGTSYFSEYLTTNFN